MTGTTNLGAAMVPGHEQRGGWEMRAAAKVKLGIVAIALACGGSAGAGAASFDCRSRWLSRAEITICADPSLSRADEQLARRFNGFAQRADFGQYLGLRHWRASWARRRNLCGADRACIGAHYRAQARFLDRLQQCVDVRLTRRNCLQDSLSGDRETRRRR